MKKYLLLCCCILVAFLLSPVIKAQKNIDSIMPVRGFCIGAPGVKDVDRFVKFINNELAPRKVNLLVLRIEYNYQFKTHPELKNADGLSEQDVKKMVAACKKNGIRFVPQINLLGHQSWHSELGNLLKVYPQFDETPTVQLPEKYVWPNADGLYCKSYCPQHPEVHKVVFDLVDEICDVFEADAYHAGLDEVFYIGDDKCPRCSGRDKAELFAGEVNLIRNHLAQKNRQLFIWGDRLIDGKTTGIGLWEGSYNNTYRAIDMIAKDVIICDWHYERPDQTPVYFAMKGLRVITCPWRNPANAVQQTQDMVRNRNTATKEMKPRFTGMMQTIWSGSSDFLNEMEKNIKDEPNSQANCFKALFAEIDKQVQ